jgi:SAM-dependent methyltransferase
MAEQENSRGFIKQRIMNIGIMRRFTKSVAHRAAHLISDGDIKRSIIEEAAQLLRAEFTVMPRFAYHQPIDYHLDSPPPTFEPPIFLPGNDLPLPAPVDRMGYPVDDAAYIDMGRYDADLVRAQIEKHLGLKRDLAIMDFGCSTGRVLRHFHSNQKTLGWQLYGVDIQARCIEWLRRHFPAEFIIYTGTVMPFLPFEDNSLDVIYGFSVFTHIKYLWDAWLLELRRVLRPGGLLIQTIHTENAWDFHYRHRQEGWVSSNHSPRVYNTPAMDLDWFHYGDISVSQAFWKRDVAREFWGRYLEVLDLLPPPERYSFQDWMICRKPPHG